MYHGSKHVTIVFRREERALDDVQKYNNDRIEMYSNSWDEE